MRAAPLPWIEGFRVTAGEWATHPRDLAGAFQIGDLRVISSGAASVDLKLTRDAHDHALAWEHVSISTPTGCPSWPDMVRVATAFWRDDEALLQFRPPSADYVNRHPFCLHWWKPPYPVFLPPRSCV